MSFETDFDEALAADRAGRFDEALARFDAVLVACPKGGLRKYLRFRRSVVLYDLGRFREALEGIANMSTRQPKLAAELATLEGQIARELGLLGRAKLAFSRAVEIEPETTHLWCLLAEIHRRLGEREQNVACLERALAIEPDYAEAHYNLGCDAMFERNDARAKECFARAIALDSPYPQAHAQLGWLLIREDAVAAERELRRALELDPDYYWTRLYLGHLLFAQDRHEESAVHFAEAVRLMPEECIAHGFLADALRALGDDARAEAELRVAIDLADREELPSLRFRLGRLLYESGRRAEGLVHLRVGAVLGSSRAAKFVASEQRRARQKRKRKRGKA